MVKREWCFVRTGGFSGINDSLREEFSRLFPELTLKEVDLVRDIVRPAPLLHGLAVMEATVRYGAQIARTRIPPRDFFPRLPRVLAAISHWMSRSIDPAICAFTFQTQSLFDARRKGVPHFIYTDHTYLANRRYPGEKAAVLSVPSAWEKMEHRSYHEADVVFTSSEFAAQSVIEDYGVPVDRVLCVHSGTNTVFPEPLQLPVRAGKKILFVGVEWERKGGPELYAAFDRLAQSFPELELHIVGCSPALNHPRAFIHGRIPLEEVSRYYREADIFCLPSRTDPSASVLAEAASFSLPVVATRIGGNAERVIHGETGFLVEAYDVAALEGALELLVRDASMRASFGAAGRERVRNMFTWKAVCEKMAQTIRRAAALD